MQYADMNTTDKGLIHKGITHSSRSRNTIASTKHKELDRILNLLKSEAKVIDDHITVDFRYLKPDTIKTVGLSSLVLEKTQSEAFSGQIHSYKNEKNSTIIHDFEKQVKTDKIKVIFHKMNLNPRPGSDLEWYVSFMKYSPKEEGIFTLDFKIKFLNKYQEKFMKIIEWDDYVNKNKDKFQLLTSREVEVLTAVSSGKSSHEIGIELNISKLTVDTHRKNINNKLEINRFVDLIRFAEAFDLV